jgi:hypothetical protein
MLINRRHWVLIGLGLVVFILFRGLSGGGGTVSPEQFAARASDIETLWPRIRPFPGTRHEEAATAARSTEKGVVSSRTWTVDASWVSVRSHFDTALYDAAWYRLGETTGTDGFPIVLFKQQHYHLILSQSGREVTLRITWSPEGAPLLD